MRDVITSLCYVNNIRDTVIYLDRIADFYGDHFEEFDTQTSFTSGCDRSFIVGFTSRISSELYSFGVYDWTYFEDNGQWKTDVSQSDIPWTEVIISSLSSVQEIIEAIKHGWKYIRSSGKHNLIICCKPTGTTLKGVYLPVESLSYASTTFTFDEKVIWVEAGTLYKEDLFSCHEKFLFFDHECWHVTGKEPVKTVDDVLDEIVGAYIGKIDKDVLGRRDRQVARTVLAKLSADTIVDVVAEKLQCSRDNAFNYIEKYIKSRGDKLDNDRVLALIDIMVDNDSNAVSMLRKRVAADWETENSERILDAQRKIGSANEALQRITEDQQQARTELAAIEAKQKEAAAQYDKILQKQADVEEAIARRLEEIRTDPVKAAVDEAFLGSAINKRIGVAAAPALSEAVDENKGYSIVVEKDEEAVESSIEENLDVAAEWFENYCVNECDHKKLLLFLFAAYACRQHLMITGETAQALASAYGVAITGEHCPVVGISGAADAAAVAEKLYSSPHSIVIVRDLDRNGYEVLRRLMLMMPETQFLLIRDHEETLLMEPSSIFTAFLPVLTDMFCQSTEVALDAGYSCCSELCDESLVKIAARELIAEEVKEHLWFSTGFIAPLLKRRCAQIHIIMRRLTKRVKMAEGEADAAAIVYLYVPVLKCLQHTRELADRIKSASAIGNETKKLLLSFIGAENE